MTNEEAFRILNTHYDFQEIDCDNDIVTALALGIYAIKKQIPKKPIRLIHDYDEKHCPNCKSLVGWDYKSKYCCDCGQAIDWGEI